MKSLSYYIKERQNPQTGTYYVIYGQLTKAEVKKHEKPIYGFNIMHAFPTSAEYEVRIAELKAKGFSVHT